MALGTIRPYTKTNKPTPVAGDKFILDNASLGIQITDWADLLVALQAQLGNNMTVEAAANAAARNALTISAGQVGKRLVRLTDTGLYYIANGAGTGAGFWTDWLVVPAASPSTPGVSELADSSDAETDTTRTLTIAEFLRRLGPYRNALAPAQGLSFDGTSAPTVTLAAKGAADFTHAGWIKWSGGVTYLFLFGKSTVTATTPLFGFDPYATKLIASNITTTLVTGATTLVAGLWYHIAYVRTSGVGTIYLNGAADGSAADATNYTQGNDVLGRFDTIYAQAGSSISRIACYNRALSAAEVLTLYQNGAVAAADINLITNDAGTAVGASNTSLITGANSTFASDTTWWSLSGGATIAAGTANFINGASVVSQNSFLKIGSKYTLTVGAITGGPLYFNGGVPATALTAGTPITFTATQVLFQFFTGGAAGTMDNVTLVALGALIAPEANAPGAGLEWLDVSGNRAHIVLPTSGVSWALPSSQQIVIEATTNTATNQQLGGASLIDTNKQWRIQSWTVNCSTGTPTISLGNASAGAQYVSGAVLAAGNNDITLLSRFPATANLWCNSSTTATLIHRIVLVPAK